MLYDYYMLISVMLKRTLLNGTMVIVGEACLTKVMGVHVLIL